VTALSRAEIAARLMGYARAIEADLAEGRPQPTGEDSPAVLRQAAMILDAGPNRPPARECPGSGREPAGGPGNDAYGYCPECGGTYVLTAAGLTRRHARRPALPVEEPAG
jgi:hypothetical protein